MKAPIQPPAQIRPYVDVLGADGTVEFLLAFGGAELSLRTSPRRGKLVELVGQEKAAELAEVAAHLPRRIPLAKPWLAQQLHEKGLSVAEIARKLHVSDVSVRAYLKPRGKRSPPDPRQYSLL